MQALRALKARKSYDIMFPVYAGGEEDAVQLQGMR